MSATIRSALVSGVGARIRALRQARGLTQAQLAEPRYTKAYISMLESGRTRASLKALEHIAAKLGVREADLLAAAEAATATELELLDAERLLSAGEADQARERLQALRGLAPEQEARRILALGRCALRASDVRGAITFGERALAASRALEDAGGAFEARVLLAAAQLRAGAPERTIEDLRDALDDAERLDPARRLSALRTLARAYVAEGQADAALALYHRAQTLAEQLLDPRKLAEAYWQFGAARRQSGDPLAALRYATKSLDAYEQLDFRDEVCALLIEAATLHLRRGDQHGARSLLERAKALARASGKESLLAAVTLSEAELAAGAEEGALARAQDALRLARRYGDVDLLVRALLLVAELRLGSSPAGARRAFGEARALSEAHRTHTLAEVYERWSKALARAGEAEEALRLAHLALEAARRR